LDGQLLDRVQLPGRPGDYLFAPEAAERIATVCDPAMASQAQQEQAAIHKIGDAPEYFGMRTLAWVKAHPSDPRGAELLGFAFREMRNGCNLESNSACGMKCSMCFTRDIDSRSGRGDMRTSTASRRRVRIVLRSGSGRKK
jgi:hypothetical protein